MLGFMFSRVQLLHKGSFWCKNMCICLLLCMFSFQDNFLIYRLLQSFKLIQTDIELEVEWTVTTWIAGNLVGVLSTFTHALGFSMQKMPLTFTLPFVVYFSVHLTFCCVFLRQRMKKATAASLTRKRTGGWHTCWHRQTSMCQVSWTWSSSTRMKFARSPRQPRKRRRRRWVILFQFLCYEQCWFSDL